MTHTVIPEDTLLRSDGKPFRCHCGCNVFRPVKDDERPNSLIYECNGCGDWIIGELDDTCEYCQKDLLII